ncbi:glutamine amidotransferase [candidate division WWE3 bacterium]|nr:glutamine amidotransferase [candidate division WWE3 bacterium]
MKLVIGYFYPDYLNLYGDDGNVQILKYRAEKRGIEVEVVEVSTTTDISLLQPKEINLVFMGGGPDASQKDMYQDLLSNKKTFLKNYIEAGGVGLFICGSYQLLGDYYKAANGDVLEGLKIFDLYTISFGNKKPRCIGNVVCELNSASRHEPTFSHLNSIGGTLVGFENHGGRTYLGKNGTPLATIIKGHGNNSEDHTEGCIYKNVIGSYLHGPILARNPHLADYLIAKSLGVTDFGPIDDTMALDAHRLSLKL